MGATSVLELVSKNTRIAYSTRKAYEGYLKKWIEPRWGQHRLLDIRAVEVESWLKSLNLLRERAASSGM
jgi:hypothetical protein